MKLKEKFAALLAFVGITLSADAETPHGILLKEEDLTKMQGLQGQLETAKADLLTATTKVTQTEAQLTAANTKATDLETKLTAANADIKAKGEKITELEAKLSGKGKNPKQPTRTGNENANEGTTFEERTGNMAHNTWADQMLGSIVAPKKEPATV